MAGQTYTASYSAPVGNYSTTSGFFSSGAYAGTPLSASAGVYRYGSGGVYPTATYGGENYAVDVTFSRSLAAPVVTSWKTISSAARPPSVIASCSMSEVFVVR